MSTEHVYPTAEELDKVITNLTCPHCTSMFNTSSNLNLHLAKTHNLPHLLKKKTLENVTKLYHCPVATCTYNESGHFKKYKFVKQHYLKMHSEKKYICEKCKTGFSTQISKKNHVEYCEVSFKCCDCDAFYNCYETLKTHGRRKKHRILEKIKYKSLSNVPEVLNTMKLLLPKNSKSLGVVLISNTDQCSQTDLDHNDMQTQTFLIGKSPQLSAETQTIVDSGSIRTLSTLSDLKNVSCNTAIKSDLDEEILPRSSSSTQTVNTDCDLLCSTATTRTFDSIYTDTSDLFTDTLDPNYFNCHMETQTDFMFTNDLFNKYSDDYSHMYTQTCKDLLLGEIGLNDIQTQTVFDDILKSVESQTIMSHSEPPSLSSKDMTNMETQTDTLFKQMLEEINS